MPNSQNGILDKEKFVFYRENCSLLNLAEAVHNCKWRRCDKWSYLSEALTSGTVGPTADQCAVNQLVHHGARSANFWGIARQTEVAKTFAQSTA
jgi:hypothetical protein